MARLAACIVLLALAATLAATWAPAFVGGSLSSSAREPTSVIARASDIERVILRMKNKGMTMNDITKATAMDAARVNKFLTEHRLQLKVLKPIMKRLHQRGMEVQEIAEVTGVSDADVRGAIEVPKKTKRVSKKAKKAAAPAVAAAVAAPGAVSVEETPAEVAAPAAAIAEPEGVVA